MQITISNSSAVPRYEQIKAQLSVAIHSGELTEGEHLPSLRQLAAELRVSVITVTRAYNDLVAAGLVANEHGRGFVVLPIDAAAATAALRERVADAVSEVVKAGRAAHLELHEITRKVESEWNSQA